MRTLHGRDELSGLWEAVPVLARAWEKHVRGWAAARSGAVPNAANPH